MCRVPSATWSSPRPPTDDHQVAEAVEFREMAPDDVPDGLRLSSASKWNQREDDWRILLVLGRGRFRVATAGGRVVATGGTAVHGGRLGWICMILVDLERRGEGLGTRLFADVLAHAGDLPILGLDATPGGRAVYEKAGFTAASGLARLQREPGPTAPPEVPGRSVEVRPLTPADLDAVLAWDLRAFGADRGAVVRWALAQTPEYAWGAFGPRGLAGYVLGRHGRLFEHLGPLVALDSATSERLVQTCLSACPSRPFGLDVPDKAEWREVLRRLGFHEARHFTRMYRRGDAHPGEPETVFAVAGPEFG
jgi:GNAT superfamily N-acetyltransferase